MKKQPLTYTGKQYMKFWLPSLIGILLFLVPVKVGDKVTIVLGVFADGLQAMLGDHIPLIATILLLISSIGSLIAYFTNFDWVKNNLFLDSLFNVPIHWVIFRLIGAVFAIFTLGGFGPELIASDLTGGVMLNDLIPVLMVWFLFACLFMPLLLEYGLMDFIGTIVRKIMNPLFRLPGRSSIDALASWMGSGTVGVLLTTQQYESGYYTKREAAVVATNFSIASIAFSLVIAKFLNIDHMFVQYYFTVIVAGIIAAIICPRIPPLSRKKDTYYEKTGKQIDEVVPEGVSSFRFGLEKATEKASNVSNAGMVIKRAILNVFDIWFALIPLVMALGTVALIIAEFTPIFTYLSYPFIPFLELLQIPEASEAAPAMIVGFADMFLPAVIGSGIESELTRFVIGVIAVSQLIYMSEIGVLLLKSKIPISLLELFVIFLQRTIVTLPVAAFMAHFLFF
ncbi:nucleoside recognition membrane protein YjiH [Gracilibacillus halotolerans]|uniref:Nucleoside recognition membrane protein YjiH n=1 Tax=Gracilibacillus halotolerans TaxID=74386 RepID=A0A841RKG6_9BACI|nr:YjiH family protein [Gracilibacillus halotolerans]MBB6512452.1 nucleoside recognition membrane protein YjiH [Gracilibacillus halotolerans]